MPESNHGIIQTVVRAMVVYAGLAIISLCVCLVFRIPVDKDMFTAFMSMTTFILGHISGTLNRTSATPASPVEATIVNKKSDPVPTTTQK
jgi:hypothetical protein